MRKVHECDDCMIPDYDYIVTSNPPIGKNPSSYDPRGPEPRLIESATPEYLITGGSPRPRDLR